MTDTEKLVVAGIAGYLLYEWWQKQQAVKCPDFVLNPANQNPAWVQQVAADVACDIESDLLADIGQGPGGLPDAGPPSGGPPSCILGGLFT